MVPTLQLRVSVYLYHKVRQQGFSISYSTLPPDQSEHVSVDEDIKQEAREIWDPIETGFLKQQRNYRLIHQ
jgi:hypothetical protein